MTQKIYLNPLPVRIWHWIHALCIVLLVITGVYIRYADHLPFLTLKEAIYLHFIVAWITIIDFAFWVYYQFSTKKIMLYIPTIKELIIDSIDQAMFYAFGVFMGKSNPFHPTPENKFNPLQKLTYLVVMFIFVPIQIITGIILWLSVDLEKISNLAGGLKTIASLHVILFIVFTCFIIVHMYLCTLGRTPTADYKAMITGYEEIPDKE